MTEKCTTMNQEIVSSEAALAETQIQVESVLLYQNFHLQVCN